MVRSCWKPSGDGGDDDVRGKVEGLLWYKDLGHHLYGEFSMAVIQANSSIEDRSQLESGPLSSDYMGPQGTFVGIYDGHGGAEASQFVSDNLFSNLKRFAAEHQGISENIIKRAFTETDESFLSVVKKQWLSKPQIASAGSCCLTGIICNGMMYIANAGDSRAVLGRLERATRETYAVQVSFFKPILSCEPSISTHKLHHDDQFLIVASDGLWEQLSNQEAVNIVSSNPRNGIARKLVKAALREAAKKREMRFSDLSLGFSSFNQRRRACHFLEPRTAIPNSNSETHPKARWWLWLKHEDSHGDSFKHIGCPDHHQTPKIQTKRGMKGKVIDHMTFQL